MARAQYRTLLGIWPPAPVSSPVKATLPMENFGLQGWFDTWRAAGLPTPHEAAPRCNSGAIPQ